MKAAFAVWEQRIAPVFDVTRQLHVVDVQGGRVVSEEAIALPEGAPGQRALRLAELGVDVLVCGAVSRSMLALVTAYGVRVQGFVAGDLSEVLQAWLSGRLSSPAFAMPGCRRQLRVRRACGDRPGCGRGRRRAGCRSEDPERS